MRRNGAFWEREGWRRQTNKTMVASKGEREQESEQGRRTAERRRETKERAKKGGRGESREGETEKTRAA